MSRPLLVVIAALAASWPAPARPGSSRVTQALDRVDSARIRGDVEALAKLDRSLTAADLKRAAQLVRGRLEQAGLTVKLDPLTAGGVVVSNVVASKAGSLPRPAILLGAHYDAIAFPEGDRAPGAEDNASGTAALLELARILAAEQLATEVRFVAFAAEEVGLRGSRHVAASLKGDTSRPQAVINIDMVGYDPYGRRQIILDGYTVSRGLAGRLAAAAASYSRLTATGGIFSRGHSDHRPFAELGIPSLTVASEQWRDYPHYHTAADLPHNTDPEMIAQVVRAVAARVLLMAGFKDGDPVARGGPFVVALAGEPVVLTASDSFDPRGQRLSYRWERLDGPAVTTTVDGARLRFTPSRAGTYRFELTVSTPDGRRSEPELAAAVVQAEGGCAVGARTPSPPWLPLLLLLALGLSRRGRPAAPR